MEFTNGWFEEEAKENFDRIFQELRPRKLLEIGSYEGRSAAYMIETLGQLHAIELHCVDSWDGIETATKDMVAVRKRFFGNTKEAGEKAPHLVKLLLHEEKSAHALPRMFAEHRSSFDFIYVDGSHYGGDVITDAVNSFGLVRTGGVIGFDDYKWRNMMDPTMGPQAAIDTFLDAFKDKLKRLESSPGQVYVEKVSS